MDLTWWIIGSLALAGLFSGLEAGVLAISRVRLRQRAKEHHPAAASLERILNQRVYLLISILLLNATLNLLAFGLIAHVTMEWLGGWGMLLALALSLPVYVFFVELFPKSLFRRFPYRMLALSLPVLHVVHWTVCPVVRVLAWGAERAVGRLNRRRWTDELGRQDPEDASESREEFRALTEVFAREGRLSPEETELIRGVLDFPKVLVRDVMVPLGKVTAIPEGMQVKHLLELARRVDYDQFPLMDRRGDLVGMVDVFGLLRGGEDSGVVKKHAAAPVRVVPDEPALNTIRLLRRAGQQLAVVMGANKRAIGVVSVEDLTRRLAGGAVPP